LILDDENSCLGIQHLGPESVRFVHGQGGDLISGSHWRGGRRDAASPV
jgi:hypothetical protein